MAVGILDILKKKLKIIKKMFIYMVYYENNKE